MAFLVGIVIGSLWEIYSIAIWIILIVAIAFIALDYKNRLLIGLFFCFLGLGLGIWVVQREIAKTQTVQEGDFSGIVKIIKEPEIKYEYQKIIVQSEEYNYPNRFLMFSSLKPSFEYGEKVNVNCRLEKPENRYEKFNYIRYLAKDGIYQVCRGAKIKKIDCQAESCQGLSIREKMFKTIFKIKHALEDKINELFPMPESAYLAGLILGGDDRLPEDVAENFRRTGTTHTVAVSGYNITILASVLVLVAIALGFWRGQAFWVATIGIIFFVLMIGTPASATRAAVMGIILLWAAKKGKLANSVRVALIAAAVMVWFSPLILLYDVGFQLSFLATLGIILIYGPLAEKFKIKSDFLELKSILLVTIAAQLGVLGILIYTFESFSLVSLLANVIILPLVPSIMFGGLIVILLGFVFMPLAQLLSLPVWLLLHFEIKVIEFLAGFSWASVGIEGVSLWWVVGYYLLILGLVLKLRK